MDRSKLIEIYRAEAHTHLALLEEGTLRLEKNPKDAELLHELFRAAHTLKGNSRMMGFGEIAEVAHKLEDLLEKMRQGKVTLNSTIINFILEAADTMKKGVLQLGEKKAEAPPAPQELKEKPAKEIPTKEATPLKSSDHETIRVPVERIKNLLNLTGEIVVSKVKSSYKVDLFKKLVKQASQTEKMIFDLKASVKEAFGVTDEWIQNQGMIFRGSREMEKARPVLNQFHQIELHFDRLRQRMIQLSDQVQTETFQLNPVIEELQERMREIRMLPCAIIFEGFPRLVRDIANQQSKAIDLMIEGEETELDKNVLEMIKSPLVHLLRNAIDHGVESAEERQAQGKPRTATLHLSAKQEGGKVVILIRDDGRGIDPEKVKAVALKNSFVEPETLEGMSLEEVLSLIFMPGFSTAPMITDISGRGVGLDVVKTEIERLKGTVFVSSEKGQGTTFRLELPLTIAILQVLLVEAGSLRWALPITNLKETLRLAPADISTVQNRMMMSFRGAPIQLMGLAEILGTEKKPVQTLASEKSKKEKDYIQVLILEDSYALHKKVGLIVDRLLGKEEVFIKGLGNHLGNIKGVQGAAILSNGEGIVILDPQALVQESLFTKSMTAKKYKQHVNPTKKTVLLVEDSLTTRELEKAILENSGYEVETAIDGLNALEKLSQRTVDIVVSDIIMPRMDGFELCRNLKSQEKFKEIPFIFVSSLAKEEEKRKGMEAGAQAYISKSQFDQGYLIETIERLVA